MEKNTKIIIGLVCLVFAMGAFIGIQSQNKVSFGAPAGIPFITSMTNKGVALSNASSVVLAKNSAREYALFTNDDASINVWLCLASTCAANTGVKLLPGASYKIDGNNLYVGDVSAIAASGTPTLDEITNP